MGRRYKGGSARRPPACYSSFGIGRCLCRQGSQCNRLNSFRQLRQMLTDHRGNTSLPAPPVNFSVYRPATAARCIIINRGKNLAEFHASPSSARKNV